MTNISSIFEEINLENGSNYKTTILKKYNTNNTLKRVLALAKDGTKYNFGIGKTSLNKMGELPKTEDLSIEDALDFLEFKLATRELTGNSALNELNKVLCNLSSDNRDIIEKIIKRDLKINVGRSQINKAFKDLIMKPVYMRCDTYSDKTSKNINFKNGAINQLKADGTYRQFNVLDENVDCNSRSGEEYIYPVLNEWLKKFREGVYTGELTVKATEESMKIIYEKLEYNKRRGYETEELELIIKNYNNALSENKEYILPRSLGNGMINSDNVPHSSLVFEIWDYITFDEYNLARSKDKKNTPKTTYRERWNTLIEILNENVCGQIRLIPHVIVYSLREALEQTSIWMNEGLEGSVLKDWDGVFKDGTSKHQLKLKLHIEIEVRVGKFLPGNAGSKNEDYFSAIEFYTDDGSIKGQIGVTTMSEDTRDYLFSIKDTLTHKAIMTVKFNDLSRSTGSNVYALSHPGYIEIRNDKTETDTLEKALELREMAMLLS